jgi:hypothetical protein
VRLAAAVATRFPADYHANGLLCRRHRANQQIRLRHVLSAVQGTDVLRNKITFITHVSPQNQPGQGVPIAYALTSSEGETALVKILTILKQRGLNPQASQRFA